MTTKTRAEVAEHAAAAYLAANGATGTRSPMFEFVDRLGDAVEYEDGIAEIVHHAIEIDRAQRGGEIAAAGEHFATFGLALLAHCFRSLPARGQRSAAQSITALGIRSEYRARTLEELRRMTCRKAATWAASRAYARHLDERQADELEADRDGMASWLLQDRLELNSADAWAAAGRTEPETSAEFTEFELERAVAACGSPCQHATA